MPCPGWAGAAELQWLDDRLPRFRRAQSEATIPAFKKVMWQEYFDGFYPDLKLTGADAENTTAIQPLDPKKVSEDGKPTTVMKRKTVSIENRDAQ